MMPLAVRRLSSGYFHIRGVGPCNWAQPPRWPCDEPTFRAHAFSEASEAFISAALALRPWGRYDADGDACVADGWDVAIIEQYIVAALTQHPLTEGTK